MKNCPISLREQALNVVKGNSEVTSEQKILKKFFYFMECYCVFWRLNPLRI
jgi:hypothetical protein